MIGPGFRPLPVTHEVNHEVGCGKHAQLDAPLPAGSWCGTWKASRPSVGVQPGVGVAGPASPCGTATPAATASSQLGGEDEAAFSIAHSSTSHSGVCVFFLGLQFRKCASVGAGPPEEDDQAHGVSERHAQEGCEMHGGAAWRGTSSHSWAAIGGCINAAFLPAQISEDDQFLFCGTTSGDILKFNLKTRLLSDYGPKRVSAKHSRVGPPPLPSSAL